MKALSIRQPWAWLIVQGHKNIENRDWPTHVRGEVLVHAGKSMTREDYEIARDVAAAEQVTLPPPEALDLGGIVGAMTIGDCVSDSLSPWFFGRYGFVIDAARPLPFQPCRGMLGFFTPDFTSGVSRADAAPKRRPASRQGTLL